MAKIKLNVLADETVVARFREQAAAFDNRIGDCLSASMLLWLETDPARQGELLKRLHDAQVDAGVAALTADVLKRQTDAVRRRNSKSRGNGG